MLREKKKPKKPVHWEFYIQLKHPSKVKYVPSGEKLKAFPLRSVRQECSRSSPLFNIVLKILAREIWQEKKENSFQIRKEAVKLTIGC